MQKLGFDENELLTKACQRADERDMAVAVDATTAEGGQLERVEAERLLPDLSMERQEEESKIRGLLRDKTEEARKAGAGANWAERLGLLLQEHWDVFRMVLGRDPLVMAEPLRVRLKQGARPVRSRARRYPAEHREFMRQHVEALAEAGLVYQNPGSRWSSPPLIVKKSGGGVRMTVDVRAATVFFGLDFFKGYWQLIATAPLMSGDVFVPHRFGCLHPDYRGKRFSGVLPGGGPGDLPRSALSGSASVVG